MGKNSLKIEVTNIEEKKAKYPLEIRCRAKKIVKIFVWRSQKKIAENKGGVVGINYTDIYLMKVHVTIKISQHDSLLLNKCNHGIFYVKLDVTLNIYGFEIEENTEKCDFEGF